MKISANPDRKIEAAYFNAEEIYAALGVSTEKALSVLGGTRVSMHCWQGDDVGGYEVREGGLTGGIMATGGFPGKARNAGELRKDAEKAFSLIPGKHKFNLHAIYLESRKKFVDRDKIGVEYFSAWIDWAKDLGIGLDFNPTFFSHSKSASGLTLSHPDASIRKFWIEHGKRSREIASAFSEKLNDTTVNNLWIPDGMKDFPADRWKPRERLMSSLDEIYSAKADPRVKDAVEGKLFGIGSEEYVVGSNEFYFGYAVTRKKLLCLDMGHYHPTETIADKISAVLPYLPGALVHVSRPIRWDSDHVVILNDDLLSLFREIVRGDALGKLCLATDFFDASINRVGAWVIGMRNTLKALLFASLDPVPELKKLELEGKGAAKLAMFEEAKSLPWGAVWDYHCLRSGVPAGPAWLNELEKYEKDVLLKR